ncbi:S8 family peptidase [Deinococcus cellulosilyticus]|uniref:Peptidase S8/S53 domain-containing protein n=1 Tax=Deinococcus cellulosilyticus (strain DSM 18568 / NBRC 106333 / KACC 11606 / 5516J-15) TaxID=1223518 RepID=A0A511NB64_DEIC1|nr:S8 family serine peptidase [Deinococcus cellulosilyticus]GEM50060.1 hypothetical protein DC3_56950 [Deinococcus cellulosilyticus NBRC 106333 = KACC 11606]
MRAGLLFALTVLMTACGVTPPVIDYKLTQVIPAVAAPGETIQVFGVFPEHPQVTLDDLPVIAEPVNRNSFKVKLPVDQVAGLKVLRLKGITGGATFNVQPSIRAVRWESGTLVIDALGWNATSNPELLMDEVLLPVEKTSGALRYTFKQHPGFGVHQLKLQVNNQSSNMHPWDLQAARLKGQVLLDGQQPSAVMKQNLTVNVPNHRTLAVKPEHCALPNFPGLMEEKVYPEFQARRLSFQNQEQAESARLVLQADPCVSHVVFDDHLHVDSDQPPIKPTNATQWFWKALGVEEVPPEGGKGVVVAVIDTGVFPHPEFSDRLLPGYDFLDEDSNPTDTSGHGTHVTGLIAAAKQLKSAAPQVHILPVRVIGKGQAGSNLDLARALLYAVNALPSHPNPHPADIINLSLGNPSDSPELRSAIDTVLSRGALVVAATGNDGGSLNYPAAYPGVVAVTSVSGPTGIYQPAYANRGWGTQISAFGGDTSVDRDKDGNMDGILSTDIEQVLIGDQLQYQPTFSLKQGTSMATPQVSSIAAALLSSGTPHTLLKTTLLNTATDLGGTWGFDLQYGAGLVHFTPGLKTARVYVVVRDAQNKMLAWTVSQEGSFVLGSLPAQQDLRVQAYLDADGDGWVNEAGEMASSTQQVFLNPKVETVLPEVFQLKPIMDAQPMKLQE